MPTIRHAVTRMPSPSEFRPYKLPPSKRVTLASQNYSMQKPVSIAVTNDMIRLMNYYRSKFESKVDHMV